MRGNSRQIGSNQSTVHPDLLSILARYQETEYSAPIHEHNLIAFELIYEEIQYTDAPLILDSGCGTGESSYNLARLFPDHLVIGIDKSRVRLQRGDRKLQNSSHKQDNVLLVRADLVDMWRLFYHAKVHFEYHFLLYQNPWPKKKHVRRRWHAHPIFELMLELSDTLTMRTNWELYAQEFCQAVNFVKDLDVSYNKINFLNPISPFEAKFIESGHQIYELIVQTNSLEPNQ